MRASRGRTIVLGVDSVDFSLVQRWAEQGHLPFFEKLLRNAPLVKLFALSRSLQAALWPSLITGRSPGAHGVYSFTQLHRGSYVLDQVKSNHISGERFYEPMLARGMRCAVVDIPKDMPKPGFNGVQVVDWGTEFQYWNYETQPPELKQEIATKYGEHLFTNYPGTGASVENHRKLRGDLEQAIRVKSAFVRDLLARKDLDMIFVVYGEPHKAGHFFWKYMDSNHPDHVPTDDYMRDAILANYQLLDQHLAEFADSLSSDDNLIVFSDHGMQANYRGEHFMETLLERFDLAKSSGQARLGGSEGKVSLLSKAGRRVRHGLRRVLTSVTPASVSNRLRQRFGAPAQVDWSKTKAFLLPTDRNSYLRINVRGREPSGVIAPGKEYDELLDFIEKEFRALINVETGKPAVEEVFRVQKIYPGENATDLPDIAILWNSEAPLTVLESPRIGRIEMRAHEQRSGNHRPEGFLFAQGPAFIPGPMEVQGDILQIAPTLLAMHGIPIPKNYEMGPLNEMLVGSTREQAVG